MWDLSSPNEPTLPALVGEVLTTGPPGKSQSVLNFLFILTCVFLNKGYKVYFMQNVEHPLAFSDFMPTSQICNPTFNKQHLNMLGDILSTNKF